jgi:hypothetical protein
MKNTKKPGPPGAKRPRRASQATPARERPDVKGAVEFEPIEQYLAQGRRFEHMSVESLNECWTVAFKVWARHRTPASSRDYQDADAELRLRGVEPPRDTIKEEIAALQKESKELRHDPEIIKDVNARRQTLLSPKDDLPKH